MPGFWNVGGGGGFVPYFAKDSAYFDKIQMKSEFITIQLFNGYAIVKGEYYMYNHSKEKIKMKVGYPLNGTIDHPSSYAVVFEGFEDFKVMIGDSSVKHTLFNAQNENHKNATKNITAIRDWYVWDNEFEAEKITKITVYFIVNTKNAKIKKGYESQEAAGFTYVLESGQAWKDKIEKGVIYIKLEDKLTIEDILGASPKNLLSYKNNKELLYTFTNLEPNQENNIVLRLKEYKSPTNTSTEFEKIKNNSSDYYKNIDTINTQDFKIDDSWKILKDKDNFLPSTTANSILVSFLMFLTIYGLPLFMTLMGAFFLFNMIFRKKKKV
jgi:hypothetical protein